MDDFSGFPNISGIDRVQAAQVFGDDRGFFLEMLGRFVVTHGGDGVRVRELLAVGDSEAASRVLHKIKGSAGSLGAVAIAETARLLEDAIRARTGLESVLLDSFESHLSELARSSRLWCGSAFPGFRG